MMQKILLAVAGTCAGLSVSTKMHAQAKGNPVFSGSPQQFNIPKSGSRVSPVLENLYEQITGRTMRPSGEKIFTAGSALNKLLQVTDNRVLVDITVKQNMPGTKAALLQLGMNITGIYGRVISGLLPVNALPQLAAIGGIQYTRPVYKPMRNASAWFVLKSTTSIYGSGLPLPVVSQGDTAQRSNIARKKYNVNGRGVKVGILSDSYNNLGTAAAGVLGGTLPGPGNPANFKKPVDVLEDFIGSSGTDEGRAMAEIIHGVAPGAELAFHTAFLGEADFAEGIQDLADKGCKVIVDDIAYLDEPFFQDGIIAQSVDMAKKKGVTYFSSAGNNGNTSYESDYHPTTDEVLGTGHGTAHNFSGPGDLPRYYQPVFIPTGGSFVISFQWDQPSFAASGTPNLADMDMYLLDTYGNIVSAGATNNIVSGEPIELFGYDNNTSSNTFFLVILKVAGPDPTHIKYNMYNGQFYTTTPAIPGLFAPTLVGHPKAEGAITTAAASYLNTPAYGVDTPRVEFFSSLGGVPNYFDVAGNRIAPLLRKKPEITSPDGGNTSFFNPFGNGDIPQDTDTFPNFFGTSAAAPHAAAVAALMIEASKLNNLTPVQIKGIMTANTIDMDNIYTDGFDAGFDFNTGYGFLKADAAVGSVKFPNLYIKNLTLISLCSTDPANTRIWKVVNPNPFEVAAHWLLLGSNQHGDFTAPPGDSYFPTNTLNLGMYQVPNLVILDWEDNFGFVRLDIENSIKTPCGSSAARELDGTVPNAVVKPLFADVFPNPATSTFRVYLALADELPIDLQLFSIDGKKLMEKRISQTKGIVPVDATAYKPGIYLLQIKQGAFNKTIKLIKQ